MGAWVHGCMGAGAAAAGVPLTDTYAVRQVTSEAVMAYGMDVLGLLASSPVVAMMSKPMKA